MQHPASRARERLTLGFAVLVVLAACSTRHELTNDGTVCVTAVDATSWEASQTFAANAPVEVIYVLERCLSSSCDQERSASCVATVSGDRIIVESRAGYTSSAETACTADCGMLSARCATAPLAAGRYTIVHGGDTTTLTVPSQVEVAPCTKQPRP